MRTLVALVLAATALAFLVAATALASARGAEVALPLQSTVAIFPYSLVGFLIAWRRPTNPVGWLLLLAPLAFAASLPLSEYAAFSTEPGTPQAALPALATWFSYWIWVPGWLSLAFVFLLFPNGRLPSPSWRPLGRALVGLTGVVAALAMISDDPRSSISGLTNPFAVDLPVALYPLANIGLLVLIVGPFPSLVARFRSADARTRRQLKWLAYGGLLLAVLIAAYFLASPRSAGDGGTENLIFFAALLMPPVALGIAMLRESLYDIDLLITRTVVYASLSAALLAVYVVTVLVFGTVMRPLTGSSEISVAVSTLAVVLLFQPLRRRIRDAVDRRFYRRRYDAARTLDALGLRLRDEVDLDSVRADLLDVVGETLRPAHASVWLRKSGR